MLASLVQANEISQGLVGGWPYVTGVLVAAVVGEFAVIMLQQRALAELQEKRVQDAKQSISVLEGVRMGIMTLDRTGEVLERSNETLRELIDFQRGQKTMVARRPDIGGEP